MECTIDAMWMDIGLVAAVLVFLGLLRHVLWRRGGNGPHGAALLRLGAGVQPAAALDLG